MWVARVTCATLYVLGSWNATWCVLPCKGQQNSSKTLSSLCLCSSTSLAFSLLTQVTIFFYYLFPGAVPVTHFFYSFFFHYLFPGTLQVTIFFTVFLQINYFMVSRGWLKSPFTMIGTIMGNMMGIWWENYWEYDGEHDGNIWENIGKYRENDETMMGKMVGKHSDSSNKHSDMVWFFMVI